MEGKTVFLSVAQMMPTHTFRSGESKKSSGWNAGDSVVLTVLLKPDAKSLKFISDLQDHQQ